MRLMVYLNPLCGLGHAAVVGGLLRGVRRAMPHAAAMVVGGGPPIPAGLLPEDVDVVQLPAIVPTRGLFSKPAPRGANLAIGEVRAIRRQLLSALLGSFSPDVVLVEHYPFGRFAFAEEIERLLGEIAARLPASRVASSLSVLGARSPENLREDRVMEALRDRFDRVLVHTDPAWEGIGDDYPRIAAELEERIVHTGYVLPHDGDPLPDPDTIRGRLGIEPRERFVVAQGGGGRDGAQVLSLALATVAAMGHRPWAPRVRLLAVAGSAMLPADFERIEERAASIRGVRVERYRPDLFACLVAADAAITMTGYAAASELLAADVPALMCPRRSDGEQVRRAHRLERMGAGQVLPEEIDAAGAASVLREILEGWSPGQRREVRLDGAAVSAMELGRLATPEAGATGAGGSG